MDMEEEEVKKIGAGVFKFMALILTHWSVHGGGYV